MVVGGVLAYFALQTHAGVGPAAARPRRGQHAVRLGRGSDSRPARRPECSATAQQVVLIGLGIGTIWLVGELAHGSHTDGEPKRNAARLGQFGVTTRASGRVRIEARAKRRRPMDWQHRCNCSVEALTAFNRQLLDTRREAARSRRRRTGRSRADARTRDEARHRSDALARNPATATTSSSSSCGRASRHARFRGAAAGDRAA